MRRRKGGRRAYAPRLSTVRLAARLSVLRGVTNVTIIPPGSTAGHYATPTRLRVVTAEGSEFLTLAQARERLDGQG